MQRIGGLVPSSRRESCGEKAEGGRLKAELQYRAVRFLILPLAFRLWPFFHAGLSTLQNLARGNSEAQERRNEHRSRRWRD